MIRIFEPPRRKAGIINLFFHPIKLISEIPKIKKNSFY